MMMADKPMLFSAPMVRALIEGRKTQTRRVLKPQPEAFDITPGVECSVYPFKVEGDLHSRIALGCVITTQRMPYEVGDRIWVRETWQGLTFGDYQPTKHQPCDLRYAATDRLADLSADVRGYPWRPSIFMPRWASRLTLIVTKVRVERLQDCSEADALAEGIERAPQQPSTFRHYGVLDGFAWLGDPVHSYSTLWDQINGPGAWAKNPWVVAVSFTVHQHNIDQMAAA